MKKKSQKVIEKEEEKDLDEEETEEEEEEASDDGDDEDEEDEDEDERPAVSARAARAKTRAPAHDDHGHDHDDEEEADDEEEDPTWWAPHAVMGALVLVGVMGFFGAFNKLLGGFAAKMPAGTETTTTKEEPAKAPPPTTAQPARPMPPGMDQAPKEMFGAKHLLVMYKGSRRAAPGVERSKEEAKARAIEAQKKAKDPKNKFEDLVKEYSDEPGAAARGGDLGKFPKGAMVPEFQNALDKMKVGEISDIVETPFGFHVILRTQ
ncbi:MAG: peptidylprolyl isomerase [Byssovorax sp.]